MLISCSRCKQSNESTALYCKNCRNWFNEIPQFVPPHSSLVSISNSSQTKNDESQHSNLQKIENANMSLQVVKTQRKSAKLSLFPAGMAFLLCIIFGVLVSINYLGQETPIVSEVKFSTPSESNNQQPRNISNLQITASNDSAAEKNEGELDDYNYKSAISKTKIETKSSESQIESKLKKESTNRFPEITNSKSFNEKPNLPAAKTDLPETKNINPEPTVKFATLSAKCSDGTLSYSATRIGTCSRHGGVAEWLNSKNAEAAASSNNPNKRAYILGPKGGCYYINGSGKKTYVLKEKCD